MKILGWIIATPFIALVLFIVTRYMFCNPKREVVKVATPMVQKIADYIVENEFPESFEDIPDLPYRLEGCKTKIEYTKNNQIVTKKEEANVIDTRHTCYFHKDKRKYSVLSYEIDFFTYKKISIKIKSGKTITGSSMMAEDNGKFRFNGIFSALDTRGTNFCMQFKQ